MKMYCTSTINVRNDDSISQKTNADVLERCSSRVLSCIVEISHPFPERGNWLFNRLKTNDHLEILRQ